MPAGIVHQEKAAKLVNLLAVHTIAAGAIAIDVWRNHAAANGIAIRARRLIIMACQLQPFRPSA